jgi:lipopolysaccharide transport system permease protein
MSTPSPLAAKIFLLKEMVLRDLRGRYAGSGLGVLWAFALPVVWMLLYTAVFAVVLRAPVEKGYASFPEFLMAGLLPFMAVQEGIARSSTALTDNAAMVKKTVFPIETLVLSVVLAAVVNQVIGFAVYAVYLALLGHLSLGWTLLVLPAIAVQVLLTFGIGCLVATITTFIRDAAQAVGIVLTVVFWATPIVYPASLVPDRFRWILEVNPLTHLTDWYRRALVLHAWPEPASVLYLAVFAGAAAVGGAALFFRARPHFADLI